jgi:hypothetical protein
MSSISKNYNQTDDNQTDDNQTIETQINTLLNSYENSNEKLNNMNDGIKKITETHNDINKNTEAAKKIAAEKANNFDIDGKSSGGKCKSVDINNLMSKKINYMGVITDYDDNTHLFKVKTSEPKEESLSIKFINKDILIKKHGLTDSNDLLKETVEFTMSLSSTEEKVFIITKLKKYKGIIHSYNKNNKTFTVKSGEYKESKINFNNIDEFKDDIEQKDANKNLKGRQITYRLITSDNGFDLLSIEKINV